MNKPDLTRRRVLIWTGGVIASTRVFPAFTTSSAYIPPQPYFAGVKRAIEALEKLGGPIASKDAEELTSLTRHNDSATVDCAEQILRRYTLVSVTLTSDGSAQIATGGANRNATRDV